MSKWL